MKEVESSAISHIDYQDEVLTIVFRDSNLIYDYRGVPRETYQTLIESESLGKAFNKIIKPRYDGVYRGMYSGE